MYPQFEGEVKLEHLQGYLYVQQLIENTATANAGAMKEYSMNAIKEDEKNLSLIELAIFLITDKLKYSIEINENHYSFFKEHAVFEFIPEWENKLKEDLNNWFADKYLSAKNISKTYKLCSDNQNNWTEEQKDKYVEKGKIIEQQSDKRLKDWRPNSKYFIDLIKSILNTSELEVLKITVPCEKRSKNGYPFHEMNLTWGWNFDIYIFANKKKKFILHLGNVLT